MIQFLDWLPEWFTELSLTVIIIMVVLMLGGFVLMIYLIIKFSKKAKSEITDCEKSGKYYSLTYGCIDKTTKIRPNGTCLDNYYKSGKDCIIDEEKIKMKDKETKRNRDYTRMQNL